VQGVTGPHINDGAQAQAFADACLFPTRDGGPSGRRSWGSGRGTEHGDSVLLEERYGGQAGIMEWANRNMIVQAQIEAKEGWDNLDEILAVPGITSICVRTSAPIPKRGTCAAAAELPPLLGQGGPNDFASSLGVPGEPMHPDRVAATEDIERRAAAAVTCLPYPNCRMPPS